MGLINLAEAIRVPTPFQSVGDAFNTGRVRGLAELAAGYGPAALQGDPTALARFARFDPATALQMQQTHTAAQRDEQERARQTEDREAAQAAAQEAARAAAQTDRAERGLKIAGSLAQAADTPEKWSAAVDQAISMGFPEAEAYRGAFAQRDIIIPLARLGQEDRTEVERLIQTLPEEERLSAIRAVLAGKGGQKGFSVTTGPDGTTTVDYGGTDGGGAFEEYGRRKGGALSAESYKTYIDGAATGDSMLAQLGIMETALDHESFYSGPGAGVMELAKGVGQAAFGMGNPEPMQSFRAAAATLTLDKLGGSLGAQISNTDRSFVEQTVGSLGQSEAANRKLIKVLRAVAARKRFIGAWAARVAAGNGGVLPASFDADMRNYSSTHPLLGENGLPLADEGFEQAEPTTADSAPAAPAAARDPRVDNMSPEEARRELQRLGLEVKP